MTPEVDMPVEAEETYGIFSDLVIHAATKAQVGDMDGIYDAESYLHDLREAGMENAPYQRAKLDFMLQHNISVPWECEVEGYELT